MRRRIGQRSSSVLGARDGSPCRGPGVSALLGTSTREVVDQPRPAQPGRDEQADLAAPRRSGAAGWPGRPPRRSRARPAARRRPARPSWPRHRAPDRARPLDDGRAPARRARCSTGAARPLGRATGRRCGSTGPGRRARARSGSRRPRPGSDRSADHAPDDGQLLEVLLAEVGPARAGDGEQLGHHGGHPVEVAGARRALPARRSAPATRHRRRGARARSGYISSTDGAKTRSTPAAAASGQVARRGRAGRRRGPRRSPNCSGFTKMVTATTSHSAAARRDQRAVPVVQVAHGGHEPDACARGARSASSASRAPAAVVTTRIAVVAAPTTVAGSDRRATRLDSATGARRAGRAPAPAGVGQGHAGLVAGALGGGRRAARWRSSVASSPRAAGPVSAAAGPSAATLSTVARTRSRKASRASPADGGHPLDLAEERHHVVRGDARRRRGRRRGPSSATSTDRPPRPSTTLARPRGSPATANVTPAAQAARADLGRRAAGTSGCSDRPARVRRQHVEPERAGQVDDHGAGDGRDRGGHLGDGGVGGGDDEQVDAVRRRRPTSSWRPRTPAHVPARRRRAPRPATRPARPGPIIRTVVTRPLRRSSPWRVPVAPGDRISTAPDYPRPDPRHQSLPSSAGHQVGGQVGQRRQHEPPLPHAGMGDRRGRARRPATSSIQRMSTSRVRGPQRSVAHPAGRRLEPAGTRRAARGADGRCRARPPG